MNISNDIKSVNCYELIETYRKSNKVNIVYYTSIKLVFIYFKLFHTWPMKKYGMPR